MGNPIVLQRPSAGVGSTRSDVAGLVELGVIDGGAAEVPAGVSHDTPQPGQLVVDLPLTSIRPNEHRPRRMFDHAALQDLAMSIDEHGRVLQPIVVRPLPDGGGR
jgi:hypothetical protein